MFTILEDEVVADDIIDEIEEPDGANNSDFQDAVSDPDKIKKGVEPPPVQGMYKERFDHFILK